MSVCRYINVWEYWARFAVYAELLRTWILWLLLKLILLKCHQAWKMKLSNTHLTRKRKLHSLTTLKEFKHHCRPASQHYWPTVALRSTKVDMLLQLNRRNFWFCMMTQFPWLKSVGSGSAQSNLCEEVDLKSQIVVSFWIFGLILLTDVFDNQQNKQ